MYGRADVLIIPKCPKWLAHLHRLFKFWYGWPNICNVLHNTHKYRTRHQYHHHTSLGHSYIMDARDWFIILYALNRNWLWIIKCNIDTIKYKYSMCLTVCEIYIGYVRMIGLAKPCMSGSDESRYIRVHRDAPNHFNTLLVLGLFFDWQMDTTRLCACYSFNIQSSYKDINKTLSNTCQSVCVCGRKLYWMESQLTRYLSEGFALIRIRNGAENSQFAHPL